jgi:hypothetical protein
VVFYNQINKDLLAILNTIIVQKTATLDMDATLAETSKKSALYSYKGFKGILGTQYLIIGLPGTVYLLIDNSS